MNNTKIGWIGLGKMGVPMAQNLINAGYDLSVYNRSEAPLKWFKETGTVIAASPQDLFTNCDVVILMIADDNATRDIFGAVNGLLKVTEKGKLVINMSTVSAEVSREMSNLLAENGNYYLDAPVSGSLKQATEATLVIMAGGDEVVFQRAKPVLEKLGKLTLRVGEVGAGNSAKLAINALLSFQALGLAETLVFAESKGIETATLLELINNSALGNPFIKIKGDAIVQQNYEPVFALKHIVKDLKLAQSAGIDSPLATVATNTFAAAEHTLGEKDIIAIIKNLREL